LAGDGKDSVRLPELLFSLASDDRLTLLAEVNSKNQRLTALSKSINASVQECSRHLERLTESGLIARESDGSYSITSLGKSVLRMFPGLEFLLAHREYFTTHDPTLLPEPFVERLGELSAGEYVNHVSRTLELIKEVISEGREFVWLAADRPPIVSRVAGDSFRSRDLPVRLIAETVDKKTMSDVRSALRNGEVVLMKDVRVALAINEKRTGICFPDLKGKPDFGAGFTGTDERFMKWCRDLFDYYWDQATK
jgi:predicted transcriptional regulator